MSRKLIRFAPALAFLALACAATAQPPAPGRDHPRLRAALHELREARAELAAARDAWPPGNKERALAAIDGAAQSLRTILSVREADFRTFRGVDRDPDFYKRHADHPHLRAALHDLREARDELRAAKADFGGMKDRALEDIDIAVGNIVALMRR